MISTVWFHFSVHMGKTAGKKVNFMTTSSDNAFKKSHQSQAAYENHAQDISSIFSKMEFLWITSWCFHFSLKQNYEKSISCWRNERVQLITIEVIKRICFCLKFHEKLAQNSMRLVSSSFIFEKIWSPLEKLFPVTSEQDQIPLLFTNQMISIFLKLKLKWEFHWPWFRFLILQILTFF